MRLHPYLSFNGNCEAAFQFYEKCLNGNITFLARYADSPMAGQVPPDWGGKIMHATFTCADQEIGAADVWDNEYKKTQGIALTVETADPAEAERIFNALAHGGAVKMPLQETFWAKRFGMLSDQFGIPWMINCGT